MQASRMASGCLGEEHFGSAQLGDARRDRRLVDLANQMVRHPGGTLPDKLKDPADLKALYRLMENDAVTHQAVLQPHINRTLEAMRAHQGVVLILHDTTELDYSGLKSLKDDLGQIGNGGGRGYECHNSLAVMAESGEVLGLVNQILFRRPQAAKGETKSASRQRSTRESLLWLQGSQAVPAAPEGRLWVEVADRGADTTEFLDFAERHDKKYLVRSQHNRWAMPGHEDAAEQVKLHDWLRTLPEAGQRIVTVPARGGQPAQATPTVVRGVPLKVWAVRVWELNPPASVSEPLEWILLTNVPVENLEDALARIDWYTRRWIVEEYHKAMKTGCGIETLEFRHTDRLQPAIAMVSVLAVLLLMLRDSSRRSDVSQRSARDLFPAIYVTVLSAWRFRRPDHDLTLHEFYFALARLGGHQNRKCDHLPGWLVLWRGWMTLHTMVEGALALEAARCG
jgi:hypothetical protein